MGFNSAFKGLKSKSMLTFQVITPCKGKGLCRFVPKV